MISDSFGSIQTAELDWGNTDHIRAVDPPFDYIVGTDVVSFVFFSFLFLDLSLVLNDFLKQHFVNMMGNINTLLEKGRKK